MKSLIPSTGSRTSSRGSATEELQRLSLLHRQTVRERERSDDDIDGSSEREKRGREGENERGTVTATTSFSGEVGCQRKKVRKKAKKTKKAMKKKRLVAWILFPLCFISSAQLRLTSLAPREEGRRSSSGSTQCEREREKDSFKTRALHPH